MAVGFGNGEVDTGNLLGRSILYKNALTCFGIDVYEH